MSRLLSLYPPRWRARYGAELESLLQERPPSFVDRLDIVRGALDARVHPQLAAADPPATDDADRGPSALFAVLGGLLWVAAALGFYGAPLVDGLGYKDSGAVVLLVAAAAACTGLAASLRARGQASRLLSGAATAMLLGAVGVAMPWPILLLGYYAITFGSLLYGLAAMGRLAPAWLLVAAGALLAMGFNTEDGRALLVVPLGLAWMVVGALDLRGRITMPRLRQRPA